MPAAKRPPAINHLHETEPRWFAVNTRFKSEKYVRDMLLKKSIHAWLPLQESIKRYGRTVRKVQKPIITCYVFVKIVEAERVPVLETENVIKFVKIARDLVAIPEAEIEILRRLSLDPDLDIEALEGITGDIETGDTVEIAVGPLMGLRGMVVGQANSQKFKVELKYVGQTLLITMNEAFLTKVGF